MNAMRNQDSEEICRVCRSEGTFDKPLYHPCICTGSIKYVHQDCLIQWLKHSRKEYCELCKHRFTFRPIYAPNMPSTLPLIELLKGLGKNILRALRFWLHYTIVAIAWLGVVPLTAYRIYRCLFAGSVSSLLTLPLDILSMDNLFYDCLRGSFVLSCSICAFIVLVWLREQIVIHGGPEWLEPHDEALPQLNLPDVARGLFGAAPAGDGVPNQPNNADDAGNQDDLQDGNHAPAAIDDWNPEWERAAEDLTWERFLGLDCSLVFLEHVFWIISLNTSFILCFAFCPFHIGQFVLAGFSTDRKLTGTEFDGLIVSVFGYFILAFGLILLHGIAGFTKFKRVKRVLGLFYIVIKVALLMVVEIGIFPLVCGWWLDVCSLPLFALTLKDRKDSFLYAPGTSMFLHWLVGMLYVFYFASFVLLLREILRPGVLWFLRNINDPDFHPIQEMIHLPVFRHIRRFALSLVVFGTAILIMLWIPVRLIRNFIPTFLPFNFVLTSDTPIIELSLELFLLQVVLPALLEQAHTRQWLKSIVRLWIVAIAYILDLRSYLLGDVPLDDTDVGQVIHSNGNQQHVGAEAAEDVVQEHDLPALEEDNEQAEANGAENPGNANQRGEQGATLFFQPYIRPRNFGLRVFCLVLLMSFSLMVGSLLGLILPVWAGRFGLSCILGGNPVHELYTAAAGLYLLWICCRLSVIVCSWIPLGFAAICKKALDWSLVAFKLGLISVLLVGVVPLLLGLFFELVIVVPIRVPLEQTPLFFIWQDWALGVLHMKIICAVVMIGPNWWLKRTLEQVYQDGINNLRLTYILQNLAYPVMMTLLTAITVPYVFSCGIIPLISKDEEVDNFCLRRIYPFLLVVIVMAAALIFQGKQFQYLYEKIKNDKYLIGKRLVNYSPPAFSQPMQNPENVEES